MWRGGEKEQYLRMACTTTHNREVYKMKLQSLLKYVERTNNTSITIRRLEGFNI